MQSLLQYRRFRRTLEAQLERNRNRTDALDRANQDTEPAEPEKDVEKGEGGSGDDDDASSGQHTAVDDATLGARTQEQRHRHHGIEEEEEEAYDVGAETEAGDPGERRDWLPPTHEEMQQKQRQQQKPETEAQAANLSRIPTQKSSRSGLSRSGTALGRILTGVKVRQREQHEGGDGNVFIVDFQGGDDVMNPHNWGWGIRLWITFMVACIGFVVGVASSIDSIAIRPAAAEFGISEVAESLATG